MKIVDEIKKLVSKFGGTPADSNNIADNLNCLCGCEIGGGGSSEFVFNLTAAEGTQATGSSVYTHSNFTLDKPYDEIKSAVDAGQSVVCCFDSGDGKMRVPLTKTNDGYWFSALYGGSDKGTMTNSMKCVMILMWSGTDIQAKTFDLTA